MKGDSQAVYCNEIAYISEISCAARDDGRKRRGYEVTCGRVVLAVFIISVETDFKAAGSFVYYILPSIFVCIEEKVFIIA